MCVRVGQREHWLAQGHDSQDVLFVEDLVWTQKPYRNARGPELLSNRWNCRERANKLGDSSVRGVGGHVIVHSLFVNGHVVVQRIEFEKSALHRRHCEEHFGVCRRKGLQLLKQHEQVLNEFAEEGRGESWGCAAKLFALRYELVDGREEPGKKARLEPPQPSRQGTPDLKIVPRKVPPHHVNVGARPFLGNER